MEKRIFVLTANMEKELPANLERLKEVENLSGLKLPDQYKEYMLTSNGGEGFVGKSYLALWSIEELIPLNKDYCVDEFAKGLFIFGSDGGGEAYAFDTSYNELPIVNIPFIGMSVEVAERLGNTFVEFLEYLEKQC